MNEIEPAQDPETGISIFDTTNPFSILNKTPPSFRDAVINADTELLQLDEADARKIIKPSATLNKLRLNFWVEYDAACRVGRQMQLSRVYSGLVAKDKFYKNYITCPKKMAWLLTPVTSFQTSMQEVLETITSQLRTIANLDLVDEKGKVNIPAANIMIKLFELVDKRVNGAFLQRIEQKSLTINKSIPSTQETGFGDDIDLITLKREILENKLKEIPAVGRENFVLPPEEGINDPGDDIL